MRPEAPNGGMQDKTIDLKAAGYMSTGVMCAKLGLAVSALPASWIVNELGIRPRMNAPTGVGFYWAPEQVGAVRTALISWLRREEGQRPTVDVEPEPKPNREWHILVNAPAGVTVRAEVMTDEKLIVITVDGAPSPSRYELDASEQFRS